jgi:heat shock protein HspQ
MRAKNANALFSIGELVHHKLFGYRGVVIDVDPEFQLSDEWYEQVARSRPPKDRPWYHVLVHDGTHQTYVAERNLEQDESGETINHPAIGQFFSTFRNGRYESESRTN